MMTGSWSYSSVVQHLHEALDSISSITKSKQNEKTDIVEGKKITKKTAT